MEEVIRKRVTQVGSGAWSIYLPKKWIDAWTPEQMQEREVELRRISHSILISPVLQQDRFETVAPDDADVVRTLLLSAYIRGNHHVHLRSDAGFHNDTVAAARDFLRHLDERIVADCRSDHISYTLRSDLPPVSDDILVLMGAKVTEVMRLAADAIASAGHDPERSLHALRLLRDTQTEDVERLFHQSARLVATLGIPLESVSQYQLLGLVAAELHRVGEQGLRMAAALLRDMGLELDDLDYPRRHTLEKARNPAPPTGVARELHAVCKRGFDDLARNLDALIAALGGTDVAAFMAVAIDAAAARDAVQQQVLDAVAQHWGSDAQPDAIMAAFTASKHAARLQNAFDHIHSACRHATGLLAAAP